MIQRSRASVESRSAAAERPPNDQSPSLGSPRGRACTAMDTVDRVEKGLVLELAVSEADTVANGAGSNH